MLKYWRAFVPGVVAVGLLVVLLLLAVIDQPHRPLWRWLWPVAAGAVIIWACWGLFRE